MSLTTPGELSFSYGVQPTVMVLWIDMDKYLEKNKKAKENEKQHLKNAYENLMTDIIPTGEEELAVVSFGDFGAVS